RKDTGDAPWRTLQTLQKNRVRRSSSSPTGAERIVRPLFHFLTVVVFRNSKFRVHFLPTQFGIFSWIHLLSQSGELCRRPGNTPWHPAYMGKCSRVHSR